MMGAMVVATFAIRIAKYAIKACAYNARPTIHWMIILDAFLANQIFILKYPFQESYSQQ